ncbi:hypothetical protein TanjilG_17646 [Lupinus angustifolius]|uniref:DUF668 domain-containing protein n=1 Tax=Lupinus angustifolius TaxID=3871 RepID=A0A1J7IKA4_LUPAN|nr:hypothetical protein TanjilG_17646 [Lupinus angustifolius]
MGAESWFRSLWKTQQKDDSNSEKVVIGVLAFEVASLMSKLVNLWQSWSDKQVARLREEIMKPVAIKKLVSDDEYFIVCLISVEMLENMAHMAASVATLGKKCSDPSLKDFENAFNEFITLHLDPMVKRMENQWVSELLPSSVHPPEINVARFASGRTPWLKPPSESLGAASLALHYGSVIIAIEKLAASPYLIGFGAREDLYNMLPEHVSAVLRAKLKPCGKAMASADEWTEAMTDILEWLAPLAHHMIRWQSERSLEQHRFVSQANVLLVQILYFANQEKTDSIITELLVGLNYVWRYAMELKAKALVECGSSRVIDR